MILSAEELSIRKFGKLRMKNPKAAASGSNKKEIWICDCGKETLTQINKISSGHVTSCGRCNEISAEEMKIRKFGKLRMKFPKAILPGSGKKEVWICDCGKESSKSIKYVIAGDMTSCGRCNEISAEEMGTRKFGKLSMKFPRSVLSSSHGKEFWVCDCGKETSTIVKNVISGNTSSCGRCNEISAEEMSVRKFGKLRMKDPKNIMLGSHTKIFWICDCGKEKEIITESVTLGYVTNCGKCNEVSAEEMSVRKFGKLRMKNPKAVLPGSMKSTTWICDCGKEKQVSTEDVFAGKTSSCGRCRDTIQDWYLENKDRIRVLRCPIQPEDFPPGGLIPLEIIKKAASPFKCKCVLCGKTYYPRLADIKQNNGGLTCGCSIYRVSVGQKDISLFIESLGFVTKLEYSVNKLKYDVFVPSVNLLIEYDGTHWHTMKGAKERDLRKEQNAISFGYEFFRITEDEWMKSRKRVENQLRVNLGMNLGM